MFFGLRDPATVTVGFQAVAAYTLAHVVAFLAVGVIVAAVLAEVRKTPHLLWLFAEFFLVFEFGFYGVIAVVLASPGRRKVGGGSHTPFNTSSSKKRSVSNALTWIDALRLSMSWEPMADWASTS